MTMLARKISRAKWEPIEYLAENEIRADAISGGCLRTSGDTLSWWRCTGDERDVAEVALAIVAGPNIEKFQKFDVVVLPAAILAQAGLVFESKDGETAVRDLRSRHLDLVKLDVERLSLVAKVLARRIRSNGGVVLFSRAKLIRLVEEAIQAGRLDPNALTEKLRGKLAKPASGP